MRGQNEIDYVYYALEQLDGCTISPMWRSSTPINTLFIYVRIYWSLRLVAIAQNEKKDQQRKDAHTHKCRKENTELARASAKSGGQIGWKPDACARILRERKKVHISTTHAQTSWRPHDAGADPIRL